MQPKLNPIVQNYSEPLTFIARLTAGIFFGVIMNKTNPDHYKIGSAKVIEITEHLGFLEGNVVKYVCRAGNKPGESRMDDLSKAKWYLERAIKNESEGKDG
jgi:hypothetical protein